MCLCVCFADLLSNDCGWVKKLIESDITGDICVGYDGRGWWRERGRSRRGERRVRCDVMRCEVMRKPGPRCYPVLTHCHNLEIWYRKHIVTALLQWKVNTIHTGFVGAHKIRCVCVCVCACSCWCPCVIVSFCARAFLISRGGLSSSLAMATGFICSEAAGRTKGLGKGSGRGGRGDGDGQRGLDCSPPDMFTLLPSAPVCTALRAMHTI